MRTVLSFSGGKDSSLALWRAVRAGMEPVALLTTVDGEAGESWFHHTPLPLLREAARSLGTPLVELRTGGERYEADFEAALRSLAEGGAQACAFGDIDLCGHRAWDEARCAAAGLRAVFPLWQEKRAALVREAIDAGFRATLTVVNTRLLDGRFLGRELTRELAEEIRRTGADECGENGEYHTFVWDGPLFRSPVRFSAGEPLSLGTYRVLPIRKAGPELP